MRRCSAYALYLCSWSRSLSRSSCLLRFAWLTKGWHVDVHLSWNSLYFLTLLKARIQLQVPMCSSLSLARANSYLN